MSAHLDAGGRLARSEHNGDGTAVFGVVDMDRQITALVIMSIEQRQLLMACTTSQVSSMSRMTDAGSCA
jgi:hypothetical protein